MPRRLRVLLSAYSCEPGKGSEPEVGWQWALQLARFHEVTVLTRMNNRPSINRGLSLVRDAPLPAFVYYDLPLFAQKLKKLPGGTSVYYRLWQRSASRLVKELHRQNHFALMHHITYAGFRFPSAIWGHGAPTVWGPVGGGESFPIQLLPWGDLRTVFEELIRNANNALQGRSLARRAAASSIVLVSTRETQKRFEELGFQAHLMPTIGITAAATPKHKRNVDGRLKVLFVGKIVAWKGVDLAIRSFAASAIDGTFTLVGAGPFLSTARRLTKELRVADRVKFTGWQTREEVLRKYAEHDLLLFPSLHDSGGYVVLEAMLNGLPVICMDCGGPALAVSSNCGIKVSPTTRQAVVDELAKALAFYASNRSALADHGAAARRSVLERYDWDRKGEEMNQVYLKAVSARSS